MRRKDKERSEARRLRGEGMTVTKIAEELGVSKSSVSTWVRDVELTDEQVEAIKVAKSEKHLSQLAGAAANREKHLKLRKGYQQVGREAARNGNRLHYAGCLLYWAEGAKRRNHLEFVNSDPEMMLLWMRFLREELAVLDSYVLLRVHVHSEAQIQPAQAYWLNLLNLPSACVMKAYIKEGSSSRQNRLEHGVCSITVSKTELAMHVFGAIQEYCGFDRPEWLF